MHMPHTNFVKELSEKIVRSINFVRLHNCQIFEKRTLQSAIYHCLVAPTYDSYEMVTEIGVFL